MCHLPCSEDGRMKYPFMVVVAAFFLAAIDTTPVYATTVMVSVQANFSNVTISPAALSRAKQMVADIESSFMDEFFNQGHITYNLPLPIRTAQSTEKLLSVDELLGTTAKGGAEILVYCTVSLDELKPNQPVHVSNCTVHAYGVHASAGLPQSWILPITEKTMDTDLQGDIQQTAQQISAQLKHDTPRLTQPRVTHNFGFAKVS